MIFKDLNKLTINESKHLFHRMSEIQDVTDTVSRILEDVKSLGDTALYNYTRQFDDVDIHDIEVDHDTVTRSLEIIDPTIIEHLTAAAKNIRTFHLAQMNKPQWFMDISPGITVGQKITPLEAVGAYVPGGRAAYPSTALMTVIPAKVAGVKKVIVCTPPGPDGVNPLTLAAAHIAGADHIYQVGGVQAVGAMAYGTGSICAVDKIVGPGNIYVTAAKMMVRDCCEIDFPAGPSEVLIIADDSADPDLIAADMVAQAEHDPNAVSVLVTTSKDIALKVKDSISKQSAIALRKDIINKSMDNAAVLIAISLDECIEFSNRFAPEHLEIITENDMQVLESITNAGSIFLGQYTPVSAGDYASGTNHVLPTAGYGRIYSGLNVEHFIKRTSIQKISRQGLETLSDTIISLAEAEGLSAHAEAVRKRLIL
ncbi:MAG: bifunctional histidinal dehydrogenase/ histidinol dehydrogenase [ANME-2 cluster archaeon HR1]|nr:MAG: bifunctional histidinal dehydrogenase/ histidinol dehydrogenase [ANME-2 cluster archaeon HR1]